MTTTPALPLGHLPWHRTTASAVDRADRPCVRDDSVELTAAAFETWVEAAAEQFVDLGVRPGSVVAVMLPNRVELLIALVAAWRVGAAATPVNPALTASEVEYQIADAGAGLLVHAGGDPCPGLPVERLEVGQLRREPSGTLAPAATDASDLALLVYTSGSTGRPKGVMLDHANLDAMSSIMVESMQLTDRDHCLLFLPLFHVNAICVSFLSPLRAGAQLSVMARFTPDAFFDAVERLRPTYFSGVPTVFSMLLATSRQADLSSVRLGVCGAAPATRALLDATRERFGFVVVEGYGLTECTCAATSNPVDGPIKAGTVGPALPGIRVEVMSPEGEILPPGTRGEVVVSGPVVMRGYLGRPEETAQTLRDGWLHTGDVGVLDDDGYLTIVDRIKDLIIRGGENVYPKEVENALAAHPMVLEAAVVGRPDERLGEVPVAYVVVAPGVALEPDALLAHCGSRLAKVKIPVCVEVVEALPRNPVGKIDKPGLRARLAARTGA